MPTTLPSLFSGLVRWNGFVDGVTITTWSLPSTFTTAGLT